MKPFNFSVEIEVDKKTGQPVAVYFQVRKGKSAKTIEFAGGNAFADYSATGELLGIELLGPCKVNVLDSIAGKDKTIRDFFKKNAPAAMVAA